MPFSRVLFGFLLWLVLFAAAPMSGARERHVDERGLDLSDKVEIFEDKDGLFDINEVARPEKADRFVLFAGPGSVNFGYSASAWWLRLRLPAFPQVGPTDGLVEVAFPTLDEIEVYTTDPVAPGRFLVQLGGDLLPHAARPLQHRNFVFPIRFVPGQDNVIYLRVRSAGTLTVPLFLWRAEALAKNDQIVYTTHALYLGMLLALGLYNLLLWASLRESVYLTYVAFVVAMAAAQLSLNGIGYQFVWPEALTWQRISLNTSFALAGMFGAWFTRQFLRTNEEHPRLNRVLIGFVTAFALVALAPLFLPYRPTAVATSVVGIGFSMTAVFCGLISLRAGNAGARFFLIAWLILLAGVALMGLRNMALIPTNFISANGIQIGSAIEILLLSFALADRIQHLRREKDAATLLALQSEKTRVEGLKESERLLEARVAGRTRALAAANQLLQESEARMTNLAQHDPLTGLANRNLLFDRLEHAMQRARREQSKVAVLLIDLDGFKAVNDTFGHNVGDRLLCEISHRLLANVRTSDTVARFGGDEFVVICESMDLDNVTHVAEKILSALAFPIALAGTEIRSGGSIGIATWPEHGTDVTELLHAADLAMYSAKHQGRGRIVVATRTKPDRISKI